MSEPCGERAGEAGPCSDDQRLFRAGVPALAKFGSMPSLFPCLFHATSTLHAEYSIFYEQLQFKSNFMIGNHTAQVIGS